MASLLSSIQETVQKYTQIMSKILKVDVEIMDEQYIRIAGTGKYNGLTNCSMIYEGRVYDSVLQSGKTKIIENPGKDPLCDTCSQRDNCVEIYEVCTPIKHNNRVIGVIGLICFEEEQKNNIINNKDLFVDFLEQISELISAKVFEESEKIAILKRSSALNTIFTGNSISLNNILSISEKIEALKIRVRQINQSTSTVLITGESGTGKELFARAVHKTSIRSGNSFIAINCGAIPESLLESELFGYAKGAFTGADIKGKVGKFELANKGTIFLDEIGDMPLYMQVKLLRVIQEKEFTRIGSNELIKCDVRIIAATNKNLEELIKEGRFREDLFYRLNVIPFEIPPLRDRKEDIELLANYFAKKYSDLFHKNFVSFDKEVWKLLYKYEWYGNVRELENVIEYLVNIMDGSGIITWADLPRKLLKGNDEGISPDMGDEIFNLKEMEKQLILKALKAYKNTTDGKKAAAEKLGIGIATLYRKIEEYKLI